MDTHPRHRFSRSPWLWLVMLCLCNTPSLALAAQTPQAHGPRATPGAVSVAPVPMARVDAGGTNNHPGPPPSGVPEIRGTALLGERIDVQPVIADDTVFVVTNLTHRLVAIDAASGEERWTVDGAAEMEPAIVNDMVIYVTGNPVDYAADSVPPVLTAIDRQTGTEVRWSTLLPARVVGRILPAGDLVLVPTEGGPMLALDAMTGEERWRYTEVSVTGLASEGDTVVVNWWASGQLVALDLTDGAVRWTSGAARSFVNVVIIAGVVYTGSERGLAAIDLATGAERWDVALPAPGGKLTMLAGSDSMLLIANPDGQLHAVDVASGEHRWTYERLNGFDAPRADRQPVVSGNLVFIQGNSSTWEAIDLRTGEPLYELPLPGADDDVEARSLTVSGGLAFLSTTDGVLIYEGSATAPSGIEEPFDESTFTSEFFGYSLSWDERWYAYGGGSEEVGDGIGLATSPSAPAPATAMIYTTRLGSPRDENCAAKISEFPLGLWLAETGTEGISPAPDKVPATGLPSGSDAAAIHVTSHANGDVDPYTALIVCLPLESNDGWLAFELYTDDPYYDAAVPMFLDLLAGFDPDGGAATPVPTARP